MPFTLLVGIRYTGTKRSNALVAFISMISIAGLALGVGLLILVLSVMNGFDRELQDRILGVVPHASLHHYDDINDWKNLVNIAEAHSSVNAAAPYVQLQGMLTRGPNVIPVSAFGIMPEQESKTSIIGQYMEAGSLSDLDATDSSASQNGVILGANVATTLGVTPGDRITFILPHASINPETGKQKIIPQLHILHVKGLFKTETELDANIILVHLNQAQKMAGIGDAVHGVRIQVDDLFRASYIAYELVRDLPEGYYVRDWTRTHGNLFNAIQLSKNMVGLLLFIIIAVAAFNVVSTLVMVVNDKQGDIAILRTLGATSKDIMTIFMVQGTMIGVLGAGIGVVAGCSLALVATELVGWFEALIHYQFLKADVYPISYLPSDLRWQDVCWVAGMAMAMSFVATLYPSWRASKIQPAVALRQE